MACDISSRGSILSPWHSRSPQLKIGECHPGRPIPFPVPGLGAQRIPPSPLAGAGVPPVVPRTRLRPGDASSSWLRRERALPFPSPPNPFGGARADSGNIRNKGKGETFIPIGRSKIAACPCPRWREPVYTFSLPCHSYFSPPRARGSPPPAPPPSPASGPGVPPPQVELDPAPWPPASEAEGGHGHPIARVIASVPKKVWRSGT
jgi:Wiskott-Aldrich syndrome protein